jgi:hypothetical protein
MLFSSLASYAADASQGMDASSALRGRSRRREGRESRASVCARVRPMVARHGMYVGEIEYEQKPGHALSPSSLASRVSMRERNDR